MSSNRINKDFFKAISSFENEKILINRTDTNNKEIYFIFYGLEKPYVDGYYLALLKLPQDYPFSPVNFYMMSPSGRFKYDTKESIKNNKGICFSFTTYHPEQWTPILNIESLIHAFISFFNQNSENEQGSIQTTDEEKEKIALTTKKLLLENEIVKELFPELKTL